jgi:hypothetical protein
MTADCELPTANFSTMKPTIIITLTVLWLTISSYGQNPVIQSCIAQVRSDSILATLEHLQGYGTRYTLVDNRKVIATWLMNKFLFYGYSDVKIDSFQIVYNWTGIGDTTLWQYNVICTLQGSVAPGEICIIGGHYDSYCDNDPFTHAPGVDDNGSAVAATLEAARVMKLMNYQSESTIRFILFAGEELGYWGSKYQVTKSAEAGEDIRLMMNMDMIAFNPDSLDEVYLFRYKGAESAFLLASGAFQDYTNLTVIDGPFESQQRSDSYSYWQNGFQATWALEYKFNDYYHTVDDVVSNCNIGYCKEITRGAIATMMEMQIQPFPKVIKAQSSVDNITISWSSNGTSHLKGYRIYRSENDSAGFVQINSALVADTFYHDQTVETKKNYYYYVSLVNDSLHESVPSRIVHGARFGFTDTLLLVACLKDIETTHDSIVQFYTSVLDTIPFLWFDLNKDHPLTLGTLSQYRNLLWVTNSLYFDNITDQVSRDLETFFENHGNMMFAGFLPSRFLANNTGYPLKIPDNSLFSHYFRIDSVNKKSLSLMYRAYPDEERYDTLCVDPAKNMKSGYPGELYNIEVFTPVPGGNPIYRFDSKYDSATPQGSQQNKIVGMEYMGDDFKTILLSFPLYYIDTADARRLMKHVITNKFVNPLGVPEKQYFSNLNLQIFPNPSSSFITVSLKVNYSGSTLSIFNLNGQEILRQTIFETKTQIDISHLPSGIYIVRVMNEREVKVGKIVKE